MAIVSMVHGVELHAAEALTSVYGEARRQAVRGQGRDEGWAYM